MVYFRRCGYLLCDFLGGGVGIVIVIRKIFRCGEEMFFCSILVVRFVGGSIEVIVGRMVYDRVYSFYFWCYKVIGSDFGRVYI